MVKNNDVLEATTGFGGVEVDSTPSKRASTKSIYDSLREEFNKPAETDPITLVVPNRPSIAVVYDPNIDYDTMETYRRVSMDRKKVDILQFACVVLENTMLGITVNGDPAIDKDDDPMTVASPEIREMLDAVDGRDALKKLYGSDGHLLSTMNAVLDAAGYNYSEDDMVDVTPKSSRD